MITQSFLSSIEETNAATNSSNEVQIVQGKEPLKHILIGSSKAVTSTIYHFQVIGYADVGDWSPLLPSPNPGEVMSILNRPIVVQ
ncbi:hypothetical protein ACX27_14895 [Nostoc piscinale CENA21]|uniref:Uncharacterized protein n=1 Tax=Nostoc piscinale CENA21 TaxID=224013 RepID=A0A0M3V5L0_9NOSO|nr:hypothetical protein [Nostoc piscinale]ALF53847.1 hypothetical protein ACX27_14895 [Nostoc piscinale CENA21]